MIYKILSPKSNHVRIIFELPAGVWADHIFVTGDFNDWCASATPMCQDRDGVWRVTVDLAVGSRSEFRYLIDGQWSTDHHADGFTTNVYGTDNSVIEATLPKEKVYGVAYQHVRFSLDRIALCLRLQHQFDCIVDEHHSRGGCGPGGRV